MSPSKVTPMIKQYLSIKEQHADALLFYRMGDFYEMFFEDAHVASRALEITLTSRNKHDQKSVPMCGVPVRAAKGYIARLVEQGFRVAICEQTEDPATATGLVQREVVRVITPGMILENELLDEKTNNYILAVALENQVIGLSCLDISTGTFRVTETTELQTVVDEALRICPSEILLPESFQHASQVAPLLHSLMDIPVNFLDANVFDFNSGRQRLIELFNTLSLEGFGCEHLKAGVRAAGALLYYVLETQRQKIEHFSRIETYSLSNYLLIDELSCQNLELLKNIRTGGRQGTLINVIDRTLTAMGGRLLKTWVRYPLMDPEKIRVRQDAIGEAKNSVEIRHGLREDLKSVYDLERLGSRIAMSQCNARDLVALKHSLEMLPGIFSSLEAFDSSSYKCDETIDSLDELRALIDRSIREEAPPVLTEGGIIKQGYNEALDTLIRISRDGKGWLAKLEADEKQATGINSLKVRYNKVFGYYLEVPKAHSASVPAHYIRKQTLVNAERYITDTLKDYEQKVLGAEERRIALEHRLFDEVRRKVVEQNRKIQNVARFIARLDCLLNLAEIADENDYCRPQINTDGVISIEDGRHPVIEKMIAAERFVPNSIRIDNSENQILIITGPNMAGKSTVLRQVALLVLMAQMGSYVPARSASVAITDRIFTRVGALDNLSQGQSTFMVEMQETANILNNATDKSLVIMDEIGRGTSTYDGLSIAWAVVEYLHDLNGTGVKTLFATHYHELTTLEQLKPRVVNYNIAVKERNDDIIFLRKLVKGGTTRSYGIQVALLAGIPAEVVSCAKAVLASIEAEKQDFSGNVLSEEKKRTPGKKQVQLDLFQKPEYMVIESIQKLDVLNITPLEALNFLNELKKKLKHISV
ncbi:MAG: DNA mismatch repair protein MutS [Desulfobacterales bacterium]|nr:DNA mismatch repair protein MutS [Desulfobacterales bacterium]MDD4393358.1 DNA mismatch repair protein MutS [Desulfobacterales bacterium]